MHTDAAILVVDDEPLIRDTLAEFLRAERFEVETAPDAETALARGGDRPFDVLLCDVQLPGLDGLELLDRLLKVSPDTVAIMMTAYATVENAVEAFGRGAHDYLMKPVLLDDVLMKVRRVLAHRALCRENQELRRELRRSRDEESLIGDGPAMQRVMAVVRKVAPTRSTVLITGESGTGKELIARALHRLGPDPGGRFVAINCAAIPHDLLENQLFGHRKGAFTGADRDQPGVFVHAGSGTVFLDEIGELPLPTQAKLLRAIEQKEVMPVGANEPVAVQARVLAATNKDLKTEVDSNRFRVDLFYRLNVVAVPLPPLRERREDIPDLVEHLLRRHATAMGKRIQGVSHEAMRLLRSCPWRGNIRELDNALQRAVIFAESPTVDVADLPPDLAPLPDDPAAVDDLGEAVKRFERQHIARVLRQTADKREAAKQLGMGLSSLYRRIGELGLSTE